MRERYGEVMVVVMLDKAQCLSLCVWCDVETMEGVVAHRQRVHDGVCNCSHAIQVHSWYYN